MRGLWYLFLHLHLWRYLHTGCRMKKLSYPNYTDEVFADEEWEVDEYAEYFKYSEIYECKYSEECTYSYIVTLANNNVIYGTDNDDEILVILH